MRHDASKFTDLKAAVVVVAKHDAAEMASFWENHSLPFPGIPDPDRRLADLYRQQWKALKLGTMPALFIVDTRGTLAFAQYGSNMADIPGNDDVLNVVKRLAA